MSTANSPTSFVQRNGNLISVNGKFNSNTAHWILARLNEAK